MDVSDTLILRSKSSGTKRLQRGGDYDTGGFSYQDGGYRRKPNRKRRRKKSKKSRKNQLGGLGPAAAILGSAFITPLLTNLLGGLTGGGKSAAAPTVQR